jgi:hypothetical protein
MNDLVALAIADRITAMMTEECLARRTRAFISFSTAYCA